MPEGRAVEVFILTPLPGYGGPANQRAQPAR